MIIILAYIITRLFIAKRYYLEGDEVRHLACAKNFYKLWNKSFYDMHPPLYSWLIRIFGSGVIVSLLCSLGLYYVSSLLFSALGLTPPQRAVALTLMAFNYTLIYYSNRTFRYQLIALLGTSMILAMVLSRFLTAGLIWGLLSLTCVYAGLRAFFIWGMLGLNPISVLVFVPIFGSWLIDKSLVYVGCKYYPSGVEGKIEQVNPYTWKQLLTPFYFPWTWEHEGKPQLAYDFKNWHKKIGGVFGLYKHIRILLPIALFFTIKGALSSPLWLSVLTLCLLYPSVLKRFNARNSIMAIPLLCYLMAKGLPFIPLGWLYLAVGCGLVGFLCYNRVLCLFPQKHRATETSRVLSRLENDGIMAEGLICHDIAYGTDKRVVVIPHERGNDIEQMFLSIKEFDLNYAVVCNNIFFVYKPQTYPALVFIHKNFKCITTIIEEEGYVYFIYEIPKAFKTNEKGITS